MKQALKKILVDGLSFVDAFPTGLTDPSDVESLIHKLRPISTDKEMIRIGPEGDGGYLIPDDLRDIEACFSPGVDLISGFEKACADMGMKVFMADKSVDRPAESHDSFQFTKKYIGATTNDGFMTIDKWVTDSLPGSEGDLLLQIDIEGSEYETFLGASDSLMGRFRIVVAEFHELDKLFSRPFFQLASSTFEKILQTHTCVHIHPNNCCGSIKKDHLEIPRVAEFTFLRTDRINHQSFADVFPHPLDSDNTSKRHLALPKCWYQSA
jgi:hypothetical protein